MEVRDLCVRYGEKVVFDHRDFHIPDRGLTLLAGPSGVGKTTLLKAIFARCAGDSALLFQEDRLLPWRTVEQHLLDVMPRPDRAKAAALLELVELTGEEGSYPAQLSGGMARRLALGRCLALPSARLLLDEPFAGVDPARQMRILERLLALGKGIVLTGHQPFLEERADHVIWL